MSRTIRRLAAIVALSSTASLGACDGSAPAKEDTVMPVSSGESKLVGYGNLMRAHLFKNDGIRIGDIIAWQGQNGLLIEIEAKALPPGGHGLHLHRRVDCSDIVTFEVSSGHVAHDDQPHWFLHPGGNHAGDLPNLYVHSDGIARMDFFSRDISLADLTDANGAAIIIHAARDDYQTQPIGHAGERLACAAFTPPRQINLAQHRRLP